MLIGDEGVSFGKAFDVSKEEAEEEVRAEKEEINGENRRPKSHKKRKANQRKSSILKNKNITEKKRR